MRHYIVDNLKFVQLTYHTCSSVENTFGGKLSQEANQVTIVNSLPKGSKSLLRGNDYVDRNGEYSGERMLEGL